MHSFHSSGADEQCNRKQLLNALVYLRYTMQGLGLCTSFTPSVVCSAAPGRQLTSHIGML